MSYIDTFDHELVGFFGGLPIYHPLETVIESSTWEFGCNPSQLVLGGGEGEHPAVIYIRPIFSVIAYLKAAIVRFQNEKALPLEILDVDISSNKALSFAGWELEDFTNFHIRLNSPAFVSPYSKSQETSLLNWIMANIGEFVYFSMPELLHFDPLENLVKSIMVSHTLFNNVMILPAGYSVEAGRKRMLDNSIKWGQYHWKSVAKTEVDN